MSLLMLIYVCSVILMSMYVGYRWARFFTTDLRDRFYDRFNDIDDAPFAVFGLMCVSLGVIAAGMWALPLVLAAHLAISVSNREKGSAE